MSNPGYDGRRCANCGIEIAWEPVTEDEKAYCCGGCAQGGPCYCSYDPPEPYRPPADLRRAGFPTHVHVARRPGSESCSRP
jgi:hypothetical protein